MTMHGYRHFLPVDERNPWHLACIQERRLSGRAMYVTQVVLNNQMTKGDQEPCGSPGTHRVGALHNHLASGFYHQLFFFRAIVCQQPQCCILSIPGGFRCDAIFRLVALLLRRERYHSR